MLKETITYTDYNDVERTEDFWFNLTEAETIEMELSSNGGYSKMLENIIAAQDFATLVSIFKKLILQAYGEKSLDGKYFVKNEEIKSKFSQTEAYSKLFIKLATDADAATKFVNGILPKKTEKMDVAKFDK